MNDYRMIDASLYLFGIRSLLGPKWLDEIDDVCYVLGEDSFTDACAFLRNIPVGPITSKELGTIDGWSEVSVKSIEHMGQNYITNRFQEYSYYFDLGYQ